MNKLREIEQSIAIITGEYGELAAYIIRLAKEAGFKVRANAEVKNVVNPPYPNLEVLRLDLSNATLSYYDRHIPNTSQLKEAGFQQVFDARVSLIEIVEIFKTVGQKSFMLGLNLQVTIFKNRDVKIGEHLISSGRVVRINDAIDSFIAVRKNTMGCELTCNGVPELKNYIVRILRGQGWAFEEGVNFSHPDDRIYLDYFLCCVTKAPSPGVGSYSKCEALDGLRDVVKAIKGVTLERKVLLYKQGELDIEIFPDGRVQLENKFKIAPEDWATIRNAMKG